MANRRAAVIDSSLFRQNADLVVMPSKDCDDRSPQSGPAHTLDLAAFTNAADLVRWEFSAYTSYGDARCDAEKIETLSDLFGPAFENAFRARHRVLLAQKRLLELRNELARIEADIAETEAVIRAGGNNSLILKA